MRLERYTFITGLEFMSFEFVSVGPKGNIIKLVQYTKIDERGVYNLSFGDKNSVTGEIDDIVITNNDDSQKVLATVASTAYVFTEKYPNTWIYITGSTPSRTRLYRMAITIYFEELAEIFDIYGVIAEKLYEFEKNINYEAFLLTLKNH